ncbi:Telomere repeat-binding protein 3 [Acorus calamus]|uniref:Telomere repeat-binding protein 3 n=1 Tax=Acorus calamus TaxID=4465 RepID=A0AAV9EHD2_ACOCL|nr:Telomere repeat-binding protein 3 [Acorus calamus]
MVLEKRLDYVFNGYQVPKGSRSARGKSVARRKAEDNGMFAFELLATVAGKLLSGEGNDTLTNIEVGNSRRVIEEKPLKTEHCEWGRCDEGAFVSNVGSPRRSQKYARKNYIATSSDEVSCAPFKNSCVDKTKNRGNVGGFCNHSDSMLGNSNEGHSHSYSGSHDGKLGDLMEEEVKPSPKLGCSDGSVEVPPHPVFTPKRSSFPNYLGRDDDENSSGCTQPGKVNVKKAYRPQRIGDRRIRRLLASKHWKAPPPPITSTDGELSNSGMKPVYRWKKMCYTRQRTGHQTCAPFKKRKLVGTCSTSTSEGGMSSEYVLSPAEKFIKGEASDSIASVHGVHGASSSFAGQKSSTNSGDFRVKLNIKSFRVPELFIEIPENATVGSLKRMVMEAVTTILGGGLRVGVLLQGKNIRDDNKTLLQAGISHNDKIDSLGFTLEPNTTHPPPPLESSEQPALLLPCNASGPMSRLSASPVPDPVEVPAVSPDPPLVITGNFIESDHDSAPSPLEASMDKTSPNSLALVPVPEMNVEALAVVPFHQKSRQSELVQRRIRRPFSVSEVKALVQAVEKLGTGRLAFVHSSLGCIKLIVAIHIEAQLMSFCRWRDVKLRAFDNAKHRTYVDLKDKWKTLVHTAKISPQQRRGEPVPQDLLDRVLSAHAYWSQQQSRLQRNDIMWSVRSCGVDRRPSITSPSPTT